jgi:hypothetical protein
MMRGSISHYDMPGVVPASGGNCRFLVGLINGLDMVYTTSSLPNPLLNEKGPLLSAAKDE